MSHPRSPWIWWRFYSSSCLQRQVSNDRENSEPITPLNSKYKLSFLLDISCIIHESKWRRFAPLFLLKDFFFYLFCWRAPFFLWKCLCFKIQNWLILLERVCETASNHILVFFPRYVTPTGLAVPLGERDTYTAVPRVVGPTCVTQTVCCFIIRRLI